MILSNRVQLRHLKKLLRSKHRVTTKEAIIMLSLHDKKLLNKRVHHKDIALDNEIRLCEFIRCNKILKEILNV